MVAFLVILTLLTAGVAIAVVLVKRIRQQRKEAPAQRDGTSQEKSTGIPQVVGSGEEEEGTKDHSYDFVYNKSTTEGRVALYQELDVGTQDYMSVYTQLGGRTYQELDPRGREKEHQYQGVTGGSDRRGRRV